MNDKPNVSAPDAEVERLRAAANELTLDKSLARLTANARYLIATVVVVSTALTGYGLVGRDSISRYPMARDLAIAGAISAPLAMLFALVPLVLRRSRINLADLCEVETWYEQQLRWGGLVTLAGCALTVALLCAGSAAVVALLAPPSPDFSGSLTLTSAGQSPSLSIVVHAAGLARSKPVDIAVISSDRQGRTQTLLRAVALPDLDGSLSFASTVTPPAPPAQISLIVAGTRRAAISEEG